MLKLAVIFFVVAVAGFVVGGIGTSKVDNAVSKFQRIKPTTTGNSPAGGNVPVKYAIGDLTFSKAGGYVVYYEGSDLTDKTIPAFKVYLEHGNDTPFVVDTNYGNLGNNKVKSLTYTYKGTKGAARFQFHISQPGAYKALVEVATTAPSGVTIAFGPSIGKKTGVSAAFIVVGVLFLIAAIVLLIVGLVKRSRSKKEMAAASQGYGTPGGYPAPPGSYPQPGPVAQSFGTPPPPPGTYAPPPAPGGYQPPPTTGYEPPAPPDSMGGNPSN